MNETYAQKTGIYPTLPTDEPESRDPHGINKHLQLDFPHVIGEPDRSAHNFALLHTISRKVYRYSKLFIYRLLTILVGLPLMFVFGLCFGVYMFAMIWIAAPMRRLSQSLIAEFGLYIQAVSDAIIGPLFRSFGFVYSNVRVNVSHDSIHSKKQIQV